MDIHKTTVVACILIAESRPQIRTFGTMTDDLLALFDWLAQNKVTHVAMESTGVLWKPIWHILDGGPWELSLVNPRDLKHVPGRKSDVSDSQWIAQLLSCGLLKNSYVPQREQQELRDLTRQRAQLAGEHTRCVNRIHKVLQDANIKLSSVATDVMGLSGRDILAALVAGQHDPKTLAELARGKLRGKIPQLKRALHGHVTPHHQFMLERLLDHVEIGTDMSRFPTAANLSSWAGMCPGNEESAGKRRRSRTTKGNVWLRRALTQAAWAAARKKGSYFQAQYRRLAGRRGRKRAAIAVGHSLLEVIYHLLKDPNRRYTDLGGNYFDTLDPKRLCRHLVKRLESLGYEVTLQPRAAA